MDRNFERALGYRSDDLEERGSKGEKECTRESKKMRAHLTEEQIDKMLKDSFPASDPPSSY